MDYQCCLHCGLQIQGRSDKKFCDDHCRSQYYYQQLHTGTIPVINKILKKNRSILAQLNTDGKTKVMQTVLIAKGFNMSYHTHTYQTKNGTMYHFCYDQGYLDLGNGTFLLVVRQPHKKKEALLAQ